TSGLAGCGSPLAPKTMTASCFSAELEPRAAWTLSPRSDLALEVVWTSRHPTAAMARTAAKAVKVSNRVMGEAPFGIELWFGGKPQRLYACSSRRRLGCGGGRPARGR